MRFSSTVTNSVAGSPNIVTTRKRCLLTDDSKKVVENKWAETKLAENKWAEIKWFNAQPEVAKRKFAKYLKTK